jgi:ABC-type phosphate transport system substrate-binding protein
VVSEVTGCDELEYRGSPRWKNGSAEEWKCRAKANKKETVMTKCSRILRINRGTLLAFVALAAFGAAGAAWAQPYVVVGSDTLSGPMKAAITASGANLAYQNLGSGSAEEAILEGRQSIAPMSRNFRESTLIAHPTWTPAVKNVIGLDAVVVVVKNGQQRCKNLSLGTDPNDPKSAQENNLLQLVLGGVGGEGTTLACADPARLQAIVDFTNCFVGLDRIEHFYRPDDRSGTAEVIKQKLKIKRFCNGAAPGPTNLNAADNDPVRYPCVPADDTRAVTVCSDPYGNLCTAGTPDCTQGLVVALSEADPNTSDVTVSLSRRVKNDSASVAFAGRQAVKQPQSPTNGVNINTISYAPQNIRLDQYMLSRRLYLMKTDPTSDPDRNLQEELFYDWATNPDNEAPGRCNMDPLMIQRGYVPCTDDCSPPTGANTLCVKTPFQPAPEPVAACVKDRASCVPGVDTCCSGSVCDPKGGFCMSMPARAEGFACSSDFQCASPLSCQQGDWPVTTCSLAPGGISGTIRLHGMGLQDVSVRAQLASGFGSSATTDDSGNYSIVGLADGQYTVTPSISGYTFDPSQTTVTVQGGIMTGVDFSAILVPIYEVSGTITSNSVGVPNIWVYLSGDSSLGTTTNSLGQFSFHVLNGLYYVSPWDPNLSFAPEYSEVIVQGQDVPGVDFIALMVQRYKVSGTITLSTGGGLPYAFVMLEGFQGGMTDQFGYFEFLDVPEGNYMLRPSETGYTFSPETRAVSLMGGDATGQDFTATVLPMFTVSGTVTLSGSGFENIQVWMRSDGGLSVQAYTNSSGSYSFQNVTEGNYTIVPYVSGYAFTPETRSVTVLGADVTGKDFTAAAVPTYTISGHITMDGVGLADLKVSLSFAGISVFTAFSNGEGYYSQVANPGTYVISPSGKGYVFTPMQTEVTLLNENVTQDFTAVPSPK